MKEEKSINSKSTKDYLYLTDVTVRRVNNPQHYIISVPIHARRVNNPQHHICTNS